MFIHNNNTHDKLLLLPAGTATWSAGKMPVMLGCLLRALKELPRKNFKGASKNINVGALIIRIRFWGYYAIITIRNPHKPYSNY